MTGKVWLVGAGPGDPGLITVRGLEVLGKADVVLYDALAHPALLDAASQAERHDVGKRLGVQVIVEGTLAAVNANARLTLRDRDGAERVEARSVVVALEERDTGWIITSARALGVIP